MEKLNLLELKNKFLTQQAMIINNLRTKEPISLDEDEVKDEVDKIQENQLKNISEGLAKRDLITLSYIHNALQRMEEGTFGICEECEEPIGEKRLMALPYCKLCISCQEIEELETKRAGG